MEKKNQIPKYPHLRFPEFTDEWKEVTLGEVLSFETGYPFSSDAFNEEGNGVRLIKNRDLKADDRVVFYGGEYDAQYIVQNGDILIGMDGDFSPCLWKKGRALLNQRVGRVNVNRNTSRVFILYVLIDSLKKVELKTSSTTVKHLSHKDVEKIKASLPSFPEQRKIAALLSLIDERIEVQNAIIKEQEVLKASLLRRLFDRTLRFPEFADEWTEVKLGEVVICYSSTMTEEELQKEGGIPIYGAAGCCGYADVDEPFLESILIIKDGSGVGRSQYVTGPHYFLGTLNSLRTTSPTIFQKFVFYFLGQLNLKKYVCGSGIPHIYFSDYSKASCFLPSLPEQRKIADLLSAVDERITVEKEYATLLQKQKAYLLRQMFV